MNKLFIFFFFFCTLSTSIYATSNDSIPFDNTFGVRANMGSTYGLDLTAQFRTNKKNQRVGVSVGDYGFQQETNRISMIGSYEWLWAMGRLFRCYTGPNVGMSVYTSTNNKNFGIGVGGIGGIEFNMVPLNAPLLFSVEFRPIWYTLGDVNGLEYFFAFSMRFPF